MKETATRDYMPQLDSLRGIAVLCVVVAHYTSHSAAGLLAVRLFFVLSGFLITRILLDARSEIETRGSTMGRELRVFFSRRFLRLYPPLIIVIGLGTLFAVDSLRTTWWWHVTYLSNVYFSIRREWEGSLTALWSLSVEEQFYLVWPFVILLVPYKRLFITIVGVVLSAVAFNFVAFRLNVHWMPVYVLPFHSLDALGLGALLSISFYRPALSPTTERSLKMFGLVSGAVGLVWIAVLLRFGRGWEMKPVLKDPFAALLFMWIVGSAARGIAGPIGAVLNIAALRFIGQISYGIYLYHNFVQPIVHWVWIRTGVPLRDGRPVWLEEWSRTVVASPYDRNLTKLIIVLLQVAIVIGLASLSWFVVERPLSVLRKRIGTSRPSLDTNARDERGNLEFTSA